MVRRLSASETKPYILAAGAKLAPEMSYWAPVNLEFLGSYWEGFVNSGMGRAYGLTVDENPVGLLLGMIVPDLNSGLLQGLEYFWGVEKKHRARSVKLLRLFEEDCREAGCAVVITGSIDSMQPEHMTQLYGRLGYAPHAREYIKRL
jgi:hypothetical protein